jgi:hypothetical protein
MKRIYKTFWGQYIDLSKVVSVSPAKFYDNTVYFDVFFEFSNTSVHYQRALSTVNEKGYGVDYENVEVKGEYAGWRTWVELTPKKNEEGEYVAVVNLQKQIDSLIQDWREYINNPE